MNHVIIIVLILFLKGSKNVQGYLIDLDGVAYLGEK